MKILVIADSKSTRQQSAALLENAGYQTESPGTPAEALYYLKDNARKVSLIVVDATEDLGRTIETIRILGSGAETRRIPILALANDDETTVNDLLGAGVADFISTPATASKVTARVRSALRLRKAHESIEDKRMEVEKLNARLVEASTTDGLTGLASRSHFEAIYEKEWYRARREKDFLSLLMIDIDHFRLYNEAYGHLGGDDRIREIAGIIKKNINRPCDVAARFSGEVFAVLLPGTDLNGAASVAGRIRTQIEEAKIEHAKSPACCNLTVTIGVSSTIPAQKSIPNGLIYAADKGLLTGKNQGRNQVQVATDAK